MLVAVAVDSVSSTLVARAQPPKKDYYYRFYYHFYYSYDYF